ncbi:MAG: transposase [Limisphaerales bacterium]
MEYIQKLRWSEKLRCPRCGSKRAWPTKHRLWLCRDLVFS